MTGSTVFPAGLDSFSTDKFESSPAGLVGPDLDDARAAINAIEAELGVNPSGSQASVAAALAAVLPNFTGDSVRIGTDPGPNGGSISAAKVRANQPISAADNTSTVFHFSVGSDGAKYMHMNANGVGVNGNLYFSVQDSTDINGSLTLTAGQFGQYDATIKTGSLTGKTPGLIIDALGAVTTYARAGFFLARASSGFAVQDVAGTGAGQLVISRNSTGVTLRASDVTNTNQIATEIRTSGQLRLMPGWKNDASGFDTSQFVLVQAPKGLAVQDTAGSTNFFLADPSGGGKIGFYGTAAQVKQTVSGSRGANAALASLLTALATIGLVTDSSTA